MRAALLGRRGVRRLLLASPLRFVAPVQRTCSVRRLSSKAPDDERTENVLTIPNGLCALRLAASPYVAHLIVSGSYPEAFWLLGFASFTDALDGFIARNVPGQKSYFGAVIDPLADKALMTCTALALGWAELMPAWLVGAYIGEWALHISSVP